MNTIVRNPVPAHAEQATVQTTAESISDGVKPKGNARPDSNYNKRTMDMKIIHGKMRIRSPECDIKYLERLSETFIWHSQLGASWPVLISIGVVLTTLGYLRRKNQFKKTYREYHL